ncbi:MAG: hypothetical protein JRN50_02215 [Nitrososphaerota archaeon]|nr:hypothetical protein [Nitrososphaerota archaeon]
MNTRTVFAKFTNAITAPIRGGILVAAVIGLGVLVIVLPLVYGIAATVGSSLSFPGISAAESSTLQTLVSNGGAALQLTSVAEAPALTDLGGVNGSGRWHKGPSKAVLSYWGSLCISASDRFRSLLSNPISQLSVSLGAGAPSSFTF